MIRGGNVSPPTFANPACRCSCGKSIGSVDLVFMESGQVLPMKKDPRFLRFYPDWLRPKDELLPTLRVVKVLLHQECLSDDGDKAGILINYEMPDWHCQNCGLDFSTDKWAYRFTFGSANKDCLLVPDGRQVMLCSHCTAALFGSGDEEKGDAVLFDYGDDEEDDEAFA
jgi:hypothetical protein